MRIEPERVVPILATFLVTVFLLSGCATDAEREAIRQAEKERIDNKDNNECLGLGAKAGTPEYISCRLKIKEIRQSEYNAGAMANPTINTRPKTCIVQNGFGGCF